MLAEWISAGAIFGIKAFFALASFMLCAAMVMGVIMMIAAVFQAGNRRNE